MCVCLNWFLLAAASAKLERSSPPPKPKLPVNPKQSPPVKTGGNSAFSYLNLSAIVEFNSCLYLYSSRTISMATEADKHANFCPLLIKMTNQI